MIIIRNTLKVYSDFLRIQRFEVQVSELVEKPPSRPPCAARVTTGRVSLDQYGQFSSREEMSLLMRLPVGWSCWLVFESHVVWKTGISVPFLKCPISKRGHTQNHIHHLERDRSVDSCLHRWDHLDCINLPLPPSLPSPCPPTTFLLSPPNHALLNSSMLNELRMW